MPSLNIISTKKMTKILKLLGFELIRVKGSHHFFFNPKAKRTTVIPVHKNEDLGVGIIKEILKDIELDINAYENLRKKV